MDANPQLQIIVTYSVIVGIAGTLLSLGFNLIPGLNVAFAKLDPTYKRLINVGLCALATLILMGITCFRLVPTNLTCDQQGWVYAVYYFGVAVLANQGTNLTTTKPVAVQEAADQAKLHHVSKKTKARG